MSSKNLFSVLADSNSEDPKALSAKLEKPAPAQPKPQSKPSTQQNAPAFESTGKEQRPPRSSGGRGRYPRRGGKPQDRHVSRNLRGRGIKKQGAGGYNWGAPGTEAEQPEGEQQQQQQKTEVKAEGTEATGEQQQQTAPEQPAEPVDNTQSYEEFLKQQEEKKKKLAAELAKPKARTAGEGINVDQKVMKKGKELKEEQENYLLLNLKKEEKKEEKKTEAKAAAKKPEAKTVPITEFLEGVEVPPRQREFSERRGRGRGRGRGGRGGRGAPRGGRGGRGGSRGGAAKRPDFNLDDSNVFPTFGAK